MLLILYSSSSNLTLADEKNEKENLNNCSNIKLSQECESLTGCRWVSNKCIEHSWIDCSKLTTREACKFEYCNWDFRSKQCIKARERDPRSKREHNGIRE